MESIFATRTFQRWAPVMKWAASVLGSGLVLAVSFGVRIVYGWVESRASRDTVATEIAKHVSEVNEIKRQAFHGDSLSNDNAAAIRALWEWQVAAQAELVVYRAYGGATLDAARRSKLIERAKNYYAAELSRQLEKHSPTEAARLTMLEEWNGK